MTAQNADAIMTVEGVKEDATKENFQRLNRIFKKIFRHNFGTFVTLLTNVPPSPQAIAIDWSVVGKAITLQLPKVSGTKTDGLNPTINIPADLAPKQLVNFPWLLLVNGTITIGWIELHSDGTLNYLAPAGWAAGAAQITAGAITYLGF